VTHPLPSSAAEISPRWIGALLVLAVLMVYANSISAPFVFDDHLSITGNPTIRQLWPLSTPLSPPSGKGLTVEGRPILNLSLALNYAVSGTAPWDYRVTNIAIHATAALLLFGLIRRTLISLRHCQANLVAGSAALLWAVHPLQTESITYIIQRTESLMGLFYLATLYFFCRGARLTAPAARRRWFTLSFFACALGMATKEVMVTAPLLTLFYDRTFISGSFRNAWQRHGRFYLALAATWLILAALVFGAGNRGGTIGAAAGVTPWEYALCQSRALILYARLALWPSPLIFDYGADFVSFSVALPCALFVVALLAATGFALWKCPALGFLGAWFFAILAPTSSFVGGTRQMLAEHRIYLSLAALAVVAALIAQRYFGRRFWLATLAGSVALGAATVQRNADYASELSLYRDTATKRPENGFARYNLGELYAAVGQHTEAVTEFTASVRLLPKAAHAHFNLANSLVALGHTAEARAHFEEAIRLDQRYAKAHFNLGNLLLANGDKAAARDHFRRVVALEPDHLEARTNLGGVLLELGHLDEAREHLEDVIRARPDSVEAHFGLGTIFLLQKKYSEAAREFETVLKLRPDLAIARERLAMARARR
jgi:tetratricopeptide (TPR) repeat protein